jgi:hypothetical protein
MIEDWFHKKLDKDLYEEERKFYSKVTYLDKPLDETETKANYLQSKKEEALSVLQKYKSNNLG